MAQPTPFFSILGALMSAALVAAPVAGAVCVHPDGKGGCETTIQAGVDAAGVGETVDIAKGVYFENVVVPAGKDGLILRGKSRKATVLDPDHPNTGDGLTIESSNVSVASLTIRNGATKGINVTATAPGFVMDDVEIRGTLGEAVAIAADDATITDSVFRGCDRGVTVTANNASISGSTMQQTDDDGIEFLGDGLTVIDTDFSTTGDNGIRGRGNDLRVEGCTFETIFGRAISADGANYVLIDNRVSIASGGFDVGEFLGEGITSGNLTASGNRMDDLFAPGVEWRCTDTCVGGTVANNKVTGVFDDPALDIRLAEASVTIENNKVRDTLDTGIELILTDGTPGSSVSANNLRSAGVSIAVDVRGGPITIAGNKIFDAGNKGLNVERGTAGGTTIAGNKVLRGYGDGILLGVSAGGSLSVGATVTDNKMIANLGTGLSLGEDAVDTAVSSNNAKRNTPDFCDAGTGTILSDNKFQTVGPCS